MHHAASYENNVLPTTLHEDRTAPLLPGSECSGSYTAKFNQSVHGARGMLAGIVFLFHVVCSGVPSFAFFGNGIVHDILLSLQFAVEVFFCISGYIIVGALQRAVGVRAFLADRAIRILPVLWASLGVIIPLGLITHQGVFAGLTDRDLAWVIPVNLAMLPGVLPLPVLHMAAWSLSYEFLFYIVAATLWWLPASRRAPRIIIGALVLALIIWHPRAIFFGVGVLVARTDLARHPLLGRIVRWPGACLVAFFALWFVVQFAGGRNGEGTMLGWVHDGRIGLAAVAVSAAILAFAGIVSGRGILCRVLCSSPLQWLGMVSYSFYLWHLLVLAIVKRAMEHSGIDHLAGAWSQSALLAVSLPLSLAVAYGSTLLIEQRSGRWLKRLVRSRTPARRQAVIGLAEPA